MIETCARDECDNTFTKTTHNQKYCSDACCRVATNSKIREKYYENKARLNGAKRVCKRRGCNSVLSRYNPGNICQECEAKDAQAQRNSILDMVRHGAV